MEGTGFANLDELNMRTQSSPNAFTILEAQQRNADTSSRQEVYVKYIKKSTLFIIIAFAVNVAILMCIGSGILVYFVTSGNRGCKLILPGGYSISENQDKSSTTSKNVLAKLVSPSASPDISTKAILTSDITTTEASKIAIISKTPLLSIKETKITQEKTAQDQGDLTTTSVVSMESTTIGMKGCPSNWLTYGRSCYFFSNQSVTWLDAMLRCQKLGGYLAEIGTAAENQFLKTHAKLIDNIECFQTTSLEYQGVRNTTYDGHACQRWDSQQPHNHTRNNIKHFPETRLADAANYCRDPDREGVLWCYTTDPDKRWQYCDIRKCPGGNWWLGLVILEGKWKWMNRQTELDNDYTNWGPAEPLNGNCGSFMAALDFAWNRENCNIPLMYLCEK